MDFISVYIKEQKRYAKQELCELFQCDENKINKCLKELQYYGIIKKVKNDLSQKDLTDLNDFEIEINDSLINNVYYIFTFVGIIIYGYIVLKCYPKYIEEVQPYEEMKEILKVLETYSSSEQELKIFNGTSDYSSFNLLAVILYLLQDYYENGIYTHREEVAELNGEGSIDWNKTISDCFVIVKDGLPYYVNYHTKRSINNEFNYLTRLHKFILTECTRQLNDIELIGLFDYDLLYLSDEKFEDFGGRDYILCKLQNEINIQFNARKLYLLKALYVYISQQKTLSNKTCISLFGTRNYNLVWEKVCAEVFDNKLNCPLDTLILPCSLKKEYKSLKLLDVIDKVQWYGKREDNSYFEKESFKTLRPDIVSIDNINGKSIFVIFDAKYYCMQLEENIILYGQPGVSDVTKQYFYQLSFMQFAKEHKFEIVNNCFLLPTDKNETMELGYVKMDLFKKLGLNDILIFQVPARIIYHYYLENKQIKFNDIQINFK